ncbi:unnamed protein product, partial [Hapterophycus canaliculatus]
MDTKAGGVLDGLTSLNTLTRESSCAAIASLFEKVDGPEAGGDSWTAAQRLIAGGLVKKLLPRMVDRAPGVKLQAVGAMRNISAVRDPRMCEVLVQDDCLTPVLTLLDRMSSASVPGGSVGNGEAAAAAATATATPKTDNANGAAGQKQQAVVMTPAEEAVVIAQLVATLCNLLAAVDAAVGRFTKQGGLQVVMRLLLVQGCRGSPEIFGGALQALHVATDSNEEFARQLASHPGAIEQISTLVRGADVAHVKVSTSMRVQAAGVLVNVAGLSSDSGRSAEGQAELSRLVLPLLLEQMTYDPVALHQACVVLAAEKASAAADAAAQGEESSMDVDGDAGAAAATAAATAGAAAAATPMRMETSETATGAGESAAVAAVDAASKAEHKKPVHEGGGGGAEAEGEEKEAASPDKDAELRWEWKLAVAEPLKLTAEVLTNLCALAAGDGEDEEEMEWDSDDEDAMEQAACGVGGAGDQHSNGNAQAALLLDAMAQRGALQRTLTALQALLSPTPRDRHQQQQSPAIAEAAAAAADNRLPLPAGVAGDLADLRATVALCAANLVQNLPQKALGGNPFALWLELCGMCEAAMERAPSCVETVTGVMWGLVRRAGPAVAAGVTENAPTSSSSAATGSTPAPAVGAAADPLPLMLRLCDPETTRAFEARVNAVGMLGALGSAAAAAGAADPALGRALVQAMEDPHVLVQAEALNAVMDVYGGDGLDEEFRAAGAPAALASGVPAFRRKVKQEGKALGRDALCHLKETALNASRFVKYKQASSSSSS